MLKQTPHFLSILRIALALGVTLICGCDELEEIAKEITDEFTEDYKTGPRELSGDDAFKHISPDRSTSPKTNTVAIQSAIDQEIHHTMSGEMMMDDPEVDSLLHEVVYDREHFKLNSYKLIDFYDHGLEDMQTQKGNCSFDVPEEILMYDDYMIPGLEKIPVRNQGGRGTCAAFAGIGSIEYAALNISDPQDEDGRASSTLPTLDLSEQRFYWMSKQECQGPGGCECPGCEQGSWYGEGLSASADIPEGSYDIPLETDCLYNSSVGQNDTQYPQKTSCVEGVVSVDKVESWCGTDDLIDLLHRGYAVPYGSPLSSNWEMNDGLITAKDIYEGGHTVHAGGHAYLIVGYRKLPDMPEEGGVCFYVKNSWGKGWGVGGISCQTLQWMREVTFDGFISIEQPVALRVSVHEDLRGASELPDRDEAESEEAIDLPEEEDIIEEDELLPAPEPDIDPTPDDDIDVIDEEGYEVGGSEVGGSEVGGSEVTPEPVPTPMEEDFTRAKLYGPNETFYEVDVSQADDELFVRGKLRQDQGDTQPLRVKMRGQKLIYKGDEIGHRDDDVLRLCTGKWSTLCSIRYRKSDGQLYVQFRDDDLRVVRDNEVSADRGEWYEVDLGRGARYGVFLPNDVVSLEFLANPKTYIRIGSKRPARVSLRKVDGEIDFAIRLSGRDIGVLKLSDPLNSALCSGEEYGDRCELRGRNSTFVSPRNSGSTQRRED
jgi:hypothetical protein